MTEDLDLEGSVKEVVEAAVKASVFGLWAEQRIKHNGDDIVIIVAMGKGKEELDGVLFKHAKYDARGADPRPPG